MRRVDARVDDADFAACDENEKPSPDGMQQLKIDGDGSNFTSVATVLKTFKVINPLFQYASVITLIKVS